MLFNFKVGSLGYSLYYVFTNFTWGWTVFFWVVKLIVKDNENVDWAFVLFSNLTMLGPLGVYWVSLILILLGWVLTGFKGFGLKTIAYLLEYFFTVVIVSTVQWAWIEDIRSIYGGDRNTGEDKIEDWHDDNYELWPNDDEEMNDDTIDEIDLSL